MSIYDNEAEQARYYCEQQRMAEAHGSSLHVCNVTKFCTNGAKCLICWAESYDDNPAYCAPSDEDK